MSDLLFRMGTPSDIPALKAMYHAGFPEDDTDFADRFFAAIAPEAMACCALLDGEIVSALYLLPAEAVRGDNAITVRYLYAGATHPAHRGKGYYGALLQYAAEQGREWSVAAIYLRPATVELYRYYAHFGYQSGISVGEPGRGYHFSPALPFCELFAIDAPKSDEKGCVILPLSDTLPPRWWDESTTLLIGE